MALLAFAFRLAVARSVSAARGLFLASVAYLPAVLALLMLGQ
jgi:heme O synthase-like polyprenyltransferase